MNCIKCNQPLNEGAKFCKFCGQNQAMPVSAPQQQNPAPQQNFQPQQSYQPQQNSQQTYQPQQNFQQTSYQQGYGNYAQGATQGKQSPLQKVSAAFGSMKNSGKFLPIVGGVVAVALVGVAATTLLVSDAAKVGAALAKSSKQFEKEFTSIQEDLPVYDFFKDIEKDEYSMEYIPQSKYEPSILLEMDYGKKQTKATVGMEGIQVITMISEKYTTVESAMLPDIYGIDNTTLGKDLNNCSFVDFEISNDFAFEPYKVDTDLADEFAEIFADLGTDLIKAAEVEKVDSKSYRINGEREDMDSYEISFSPTELEKALNTAVKSVMDNKTLMEQLTQLFAMSAGVDFYLDPDQLDDIEGEIEDALYDLVEEFVYEYSRLDDDYIVVQVYKGRVVRIATPGNDGQNISIMVNSTSDFLEGITVTSYGYEQSYSFTSDGSQFVASGTDNYGESYKLTYDYDSRVNNVRISDGYNSESFTLDSTEKDRLILSVDGTFEVEFNKNQLSSKWFDQSSKFERILTYSESDLMRIGSNLFF